MHHPLDLHNVARRLINEQHPPVADTDAQRIAHSLEADRPHGRFFDGALDPTENAETRQGIQPFEVANARVVNRSVGLKGPAPAPLPPGCASAPPRSPLAPP